MTLLDLTEELCRPDITALQVEALQHREGVRQIEGTLTLDICEIQPCNTCPESNCKNALIRGENVFLGDRPLNPLIEIIFAFREEERPMLLKRKKGERVTIHGTVNQVDIQVLGSMTNKSNDRLRLISLEGCTIVSLPVEEQPHDNP